MFGCFVSMVTKKSTTQLFTVVHEKGVCQDGSVTPYWRQEAIHKRDVE